MKYVILPLTLSMFLLAACTSTATNVNSNQPVIKNQPTQEVPVGDGIGDGPRDDAPVSEQDKNNPKFGERLKLPAAFAKENGTAKEVWDWVHALEKTYERGMLSQLTYTEEQKTKLDQWLSEFLGEDLKNSRLKKSLTPVEGGYRVVNPRYVYDYPSDDFMIQSVDQLDLQKTDKNALVLKANLIVVQDTKIEAVYTIAKEQGKWKLVDYSYKMIR